MHILIGLGRLFAPLAIVGGFGLGVLGIAYIRATRPYDPARPWGFVFLLAGIGLVAYAANDAWVDAEDAREREAVQRCHDDPTACLRARARLEERSNTR
jgi:hypothetical protein